MSFNKIQLYFLLAPLNSFSEANTKFQFYLNCSPEKIHGTQTAAGDCE